MDGLKSLNIEEEMRRTTNSLVESRDYNRFQHLLNFFQDSLEAPIAIPKKSDILNENRNEALLKIREKIKAKPKRTQELATINKENSLLYP
jgi:histone acetyltransferase (RNA polymerase elongator complex component)